MIHGESEPTRSSGVFKISPKINSEQLIIWSKQKWPSEGRRRLGAEIIKNGQELLAARNIDWELVLRNMRVVQLGTVYYGEAAIAVRDAQIIGALAVGGN
jgi:hypothetical protein